MTDTETSHTKLSLQLKASKSKSKKKASAFGDVDDEYEHALHPPERPRDTPLVIPLESNRWKGPRQDDNSKIMTDEDREAARLLQADAENSDATTEAATRVITATKNSNTDREQYEQDLQRLPDEPNIHSEQYQRVPIAEFGSALLRGMGWNGEESKGDTEMSMPRPHRLGLGATPDLSESVHLRKKPLRPDQFQQQAKLQKQREEYEKQRIEQKKWDKQKTLQDGSLIMVGSQRAQIIQLVGVPGLNNVKIQFEGDSEHTIVKRGELGDLLLRSELEEQPFRHAESTNIKKEDSRRDPSSDDGHRASTKRKDRKEEDERKKLKRSRLNDDRSAIKWVVPHIRVRIITEKLGRRYFKEKAVVVDVTPKGATLQLDSGTILDQVPERYLETALPKTGGLVVILKDHHPKGRLLEKGRSTGVVQYLEDMTVETLSLDDLAEWMGSVDEEY
ncbi:G patch domain and KOW motifs-containing protein [Fistulifera solaris]|uniref:G patch domain and KOW motifs-containing protein n=1 Tax=Fistulifera solaris TaxID=1519565 RepID=A0A1Z5JZ25_FISSO|nr:G patch domain and KOW motifs-containing protein [Fistulifera solaris]|eukprot:GAX19303.1 G patch domain and KOW motifs-containing protein [Fistulifera solaris]